MNSNIIVIFIILISDERFEMKFLCALLGGSLANRAQICDKNDMECRKKSENKSMFILNNFNDWFQLNQVDGSKKFLPVLILIK